MQPQYKFKLLCLSVKQTDVGFSGVVLSRMRRDQRTGNCNIARVPEFKARIYIITCLDKFRKRLEVNGEDNLKS